MEPDHLSVLRPKYLARLSERAELLKAFLGKGTSTTQDWSEMHRLAHSMASSAAIYGYGDLSAAARAAEAVLGEPKADPIASQAALGRLLSCARTVLAAAA